MLIFQVLPYSLYLDLQSSLGRVAQSLRHIFSVFLAINCLSAALRSYFSVIFQILGPLGMVNSFILLDLVPSPLLNFFGFQHTWLSINHQKHLSLSHRFLCEFQTWEQLFALLYLFMQTFRIGFSPSSFSLSQPRFSPKKIISSSS